MSGGYDATILRFSLQSAPDPFSGPLVLRLFQATVDAQRAPREAAVQNALAELGYLAPRVFVAEARIEPLGGAFLIMERMPGRPLGSEFEGLSIKGLRQTFDTLRQLPRIRREMLRLWDEAQTRLQALPVRDFVDRIERAGISGEIFTFDANFASMRAAAEEFGLEGLRPAFDWLVATSAKPVTKSCDLSRRFSAIERSCRSWTLDRRDRLGEDDNRRSGLRLRSGDGHPCDRADTRSRCVESRYARIHE